MDPAQAGGPVTRTWSTAALPAEPSRVAKGGALIRELLGRAGGDVVHATVPTGHVSSSGLNHASYELFYVIAGSGWMWIDARDGHAVRLRPGVSVCIPPGTVFQYRADAAPKGRDIEMLVPVAPPWNSHNTAASDRRLWKEDDPPPKPEDMSTSLEFTKALPALANYAAPDGSQIKLLVECPLGGISQAWLNAGSVSAPVTHRTVEEIWYVTSGYGELWRVPESGAGEVAHDSGEVTALSPGACVDIPLHTAFQFRGDGVEGVTVLIFTFPRWPGQDEADPVAQAARWPFCEARQPQVRQQTSATPTSLARSWLRC